MAWIYSLIRIILVFENSYMSTTFTSFLPLPLHPPTPSTSPPLPQIHCHCAKTARQRVLIDIQSLPYIRTCLHLNLLIHQENFVNHS